MDFSAQTARQITDAARSLTGNYMKSETLEILKNIEDAASNGKEFYDIGYLDPVIVERLKHLKFKVDVRMNSSYRIQW